MRGLGLWGEGGLGGGEGEGGRESCVSNACPQ